MLVEHLRGSTFLKIHRTLRMSPAMAAGVTDRLWKFCYPLGSLRAKGGKSGVIYLKSTLAGFLAVLAAAILTVIVVVVYLSIASRSSETGAVGWDPISLAKPLT